MWCGEGETIIISFCITHIYIYIAINLFVCHIVTQYACILAVHPTYLNNTGNCVILSPLGLPDSAALNHAAALHRCMMQWYLSCQLASGRLLFVRVPLYCPLITCRIPQQVLMTTQDYMHCLFLSKQVSCIKGTVCVYVHSESHVHSWLSIRT